MKSRESTLSQQVDEHRPVEKDLEEQGQIPGAPSNLSPVYSTSSHTFNPPNIVTWDSEDDPSRPVNFPRWRKWTLITLCSFMAFWGGLASAMFAPNVPDLMREFKSTNDGLATFVVTVYVLGIALGPLVFAPLSELYGRLLIQHVGSSGFLIFTIACGLSQNLNTLITMRFFQGIFAGVPMTNGGGIIADIIVKEERAVPLSVFTFGQLVGPILGPVLGPFVGDAKGWRFIFWVNSIGVGATLLPSFILWKETYGPVLLAREAARLRKETGNADLHSEFDGGLSPQQHILRAAIRASKMLIYSPPHLLLSLHTGLVYSYVYILYTTMSQIFRENYKFKPNLVGLSFIGVGIGFILGQVIFAKLSDPIVLLLAKKRGGKMKPEDRLPIACVGGLVGVVGMFWYAWSLESGVHWIVPILGTLVMQAGNVNIYIPIMSYTIDLFEIFSSSGLAGNNVVRCAVATTLPLAVPPLYSKIGLGWGNSVLGFLALAMATIPFLLLAHGEKMRGWNKKRLNNL